MKKTKYLKVNRDECEIFFDTKEEKAFDFSSINDYRSIYKFSNSLHRDRKVALDYETKPLKGIEKYITFAILGFFYMMFLVFLPFSLIVCLKKVKENERLVVYRLGRIKAPAYKPGYCILFPFIDNYQRFNVIQKEMHLPNLQIYNHDNAIVDLSCQIRYRIDDVIKLTNSLQDLTHSLKSIARSVLVGLVSKINISKLELEKDYLKQDLINSMNEEVKKWGIQIIHVEITINEIIQDESNEKGEDPALKTLSTVFKSIFNGNNSNVTTVNPFPMTSSAANVEKTLFDSAGVEKFLEMLSKEIPPEIIAQFQTDGTSFLSPSSQKLSSVEDVSYDSPMGILKLVEPLINEKLVQDINTAYEFHINVENDASSSVQVYHLDLKTPPKGSIGKGSSLFARADCIIKLSEQDLRELLMDNLKPFTAYMSGRIEVEGALQDVFKLKKTISNVTNTFLAKTKH